MNIDWNLEKLSKIFQVFVNICHMNINVVDDNMRYFNSSHYTYNAYCAEIQNLPNGKELCKKSDKCLFKKCRESVKVETQICPAGLMDIAIPIIWNGKIVGYIVLGQIKVKDNFDSATDYLRSLNLNIEKMKKYYDELELFSHDKINDIVTLSSMFSKYILMENIMKLEFNNVLDMACLYIDEHIDGNLSIENITKSIGVSKSALYKNFKSQYNCTPGDYINGQRIDKSISMLLYSDCSIDEISYRVGFSSASYYSKIFKKKYGISPLKYRKLKKTEQTV